MSIVLHIDTATSTARLCLAENGIVLHSLSNNTKNDHGAFLQPGIAELLKFTGISLPDIDAVAVTAGPGSYTGLRVGMSSAKGLCYALNKPLLLLNTLTVLAASAIEANPQQGAWLCPMIDARRMEVFTALYDQKLEEILTPCALVINESFLADELEKNPIRFFGDGAQKWENICRFPSASFEEISITANAISQLAYAHFCKKEFTSLAYSEPFYLKPFYDAPKQAGK